MMGRRRDETVRMLLGLCGVIVLVLIGSTVSAQIEMAAIAGTVTDEEGNPLEGVVITLKHLERGRETVVKSDKAGRFFRRGMFGGQYEFTLQKEGFQPIGEKVTLSTGRDQRFDFKLARAAPVGAAEFQQGVQAFETGNIEDAIKAFEAAVAKAPDLPEGYVNLALAYLRAKRVDDAIAQLEKASAMAPDQPRILYRLGGAYVEATKNDKAIEAFEKGLGASPDLTDPLAFEATVTLGAVYFATGKNEEAIGRFQQAIAVQPSAAAPNLGLGKALFSKGDVEGALKHFKAVVAAAPGTPEAAEAETFIKELEKTTPPEQGAQG